MKLETTARQLRSALALLSRAVERRNTYPVLGCVHIEGARLRTTNLDHEIAASVPATEAKGETCIDFYRLRGLVSLIAPDEVISIVGGKDAAEIRFAGGRYDLPVMAADGFPNLVKPDAAIFERTSLVDVGFKDAVAFVRKTISNEETRYYLNGFCVSANLDGETCLVTTDGHKMSVAPIALKAGWMQGKIVPRDAASVLVTMPEPESVSYLAGEKVRFAWPGVTLTSKLIEGTFPDWKRVLPKLDDRSVGLTVDRHAFDAALARAQVVSGKRNALTLSFVDGMAVVATSHPDRGTAREFLPAVAATNAGQGAVVSFDPAYMRALIGLIREERVRIAFADNGAPMKLTAPGSKRWAILMPMRADHEKLAMAALEEAMPAPLGRAA